MKNEKDTVARIISHLVPWLQAKMPAAAAMAISDIQKPGMGLSNETYLFDLSWVEGGVKKNRGMVLRSAPADLKVFPDYHLNHQFLVMKALRGTAVPVPEMLWMEEDRSVLGTPFYVMERLVGTMAKDYPSYHSAGILYDRTPQEREKIWWDSVEVLSQIHRVDWKSKELDFLGAPGGGTDPIDRQLVYWERFFDWIKDDPGETHPIIEKAVQWLRENRYAPERICLNWGDARVGNLLYGETNGEIVAALDWEMAFLGDPEADLAWFIFIDRFLSEEYGLPRLEGLPGSGETVKRYEELTGWKVKNFPYNEVFAAMRFAMILVSVLKKLMILGMHSYADNIKNNFCTRYLAGVLGMQMPGQEKKAEAVNIKEARVSILFRLSGPGGHDWHILSDRGVATRHEGSIDGAICTVRATADDWRALQTGELNQLDAWSTGRLVVDGDLNVMIQLKDDIRRLSLS